MKKYVYAYSHADDDACVIEKMDTDLNFLDGKAHKDEFKSGLVVTANPTFGNELRDVIKNSKFSLIISERLKDFLEKENLKDNEFIPITIIGKKKALIADNYFLLNQTTLVDCIDMEKSEVDRNPRKPDLLISVDRLVINESLIDSKVKLFRPKYHPGMLMVKRELADKIKEMNFTGIEFGEIDEYDQFLTL